MPNGRSGDDSYADIVFHKRDLYSKRAADLVREIDLLSDEQGKNELANLLRHEYDQYGTPDVAKLERVLTEIRDGLKGETTVTRWHRRPRARGGHLPFQVEE
jgi:hypothetical protein